jgi:flagellar protein FliS
MRSKNAVATYHQVSAHGGSPVGMIVSLYDTILRDFRRAQAALDAGIVETRVFELNHAVDVIGHLEGVLDHKRGGEAARRLEGFYRITRGMILAANAEPSRASIDALIELYAPVRQAWQDVERKLQSDAPQAAVTPADPSKTDEVARELVAAGASDSGDAPQKKWSA